MRRGRIAVSMMLAASGCFAPTGNGGSITDAGTSTGEPSTGEPATTGEPLPTTDEPLTTSPGTGTGTDAGTTGEPPVDCLDQPFISDDTLVTTVAVDLASEAVPLADRPYTRYLSLVHLHNAGLCDAQIDVTRRAVNKLLNSLSRFSLLVAPEPIDPGRLLYRLDLRDYTWDAAVGETVRLTENSHYYPDPAELEKLYLDRWEMLADQSPYLLRLDDEQAQKIAADTATATPILRADALIDAASRAPLYYDMLALPLDHAGLQKLLDIDLAAQVLDERSADSEVVARAAFHLSPLTARVRGVERQLFPTATTRAYWRTFDFIETEGIFAAPFDFVADGSEVLFNLPNGLQAYAAFDAAGARQSSLGPERFTDPQQPDGVARAGISCIGCHIDGPHPAQDDLRWELDLGINPIKYDSQIAQEVLRVYPLRDVFAALIAVDAARFQVALTQLGLPTGGPEPVLAAYLDFNADLDLRRAAAEFSLAPGTDISYAFGMLSPDLAVLLEPGGTLSRAEFTVSFAASACILHRGRTRCCPDGALLPECGG